MQTTKVIKATRTDEIRFVFPQIGSFNYLYNATTKNANQPSQACKKYVHKLIIKDISTNVIDFDLRNI